MRFVGRDAQSLPYDGLFNRALEQVSRSWSFCANLIVLAAVSTPSVSGLRTARRKGDVARLGSGCRMLRQVGPAIST